MGRVMTGARALAAITAICGQLAATSGAAQTRPEPRLAAIERTVDALDFALPRHRDMLAAARLRFSQTIATLSDDGGPRIVGRDRVPFDLDGHAKLDEGVWKSEGTFLRQGAGAGSDVAVRRLVFGDFILRHDDRRGLELGFDARIAEEQTSGDGTMIGRFAGLTHTRSVTKGGARIGLSAGAYALRRLGPRLDAAGYATIGLDLHRWRDGDGARRSLTAARTTVGGALSGTVRTGQFEFEPAISAQYGAAFATAGGAVRASDARIDLAPRFGFALEHRPVSEPRRRIDLTPRIVCRHSSAALSTPACGHGAALHLTSSSRDDATTFRAGLEVEREEARSLGATLSLSRQF